MAQLTSWSPIFCRILRCFATKEMSAQPGIRTPDLLHVKPVCYHYATATSCNIELKVGSLNHLKYSLVSNFLSEINKAISYFIYLLNTLMGLCKSISDFSSFLKMSTNKLRVLKMNGKLLLNKSRVISCVKCEPRQGKSRESVSLLA